MNGDQKYEIAVKYLNDLIDGKKPCDVPEILQDDPALGQLAGTIRSIREGVLALGKGDLSSEIPGRGFTVGTLKALQGALRHLVWQSRAIAAGDFNQKVDFLGELSDAFNEMARALDERTDALCRSEIKYRLLFENATDAIAVVVGGRIALHNARLERLSGAPLQGLCFFELFIDADREIAQDLVAEVSDGKEQENPVTLRAAAGGGVAWLEVRGVQIDWYGKTAQIFFLTDVTTHKCAERALSVSEEKYRLMAENAQDVIWVLDLSSDCYTYISPSVFSLRGLTAEEALRERVADSMTQESYARVSAYLAQRVEEFESGGDVANPVIEIDQYAKDGSVVCTEVSIRLRFNAYGGLEAVGISRDVSVRKSNERQILYLNQHDPLTDLHNRRFYSERLQVLDTAENMPLSMVLIDVNGLKLINDAFGHMAGDKLLVTFAQVLRASLRASDVAARIGGDEFVLLLPRTPFEAAGRIVERVREALLARAVEDVTITASFGIATKNGVGEDIDAIYRSAEDSMYREKLALNRQVKSDMLLQILSSLDKQSDSEHRHSEAVGRLRMALGREKQLDSDDVEKLLSTGLYHDTGKVAPDDALIDGEVARLFIDKMLKTEAEPRPTSIPDGGGD